MSVEVIFKMPRASEILQLRKAALYRCEIDLPWLREKGDIKISCSEGTLYVHLGSWFENEARKSIEFDCEVLTNNGKRFVGEQMNLFKVLRYMADRRDAINGQDTLALCVRLWPVSSSFSLNVQSPAGKEKTVWCEVEGFSNLSTGVEKIIHTDDDETSIFIVFVMGNVCVKFKSHANSCAVLREVNVLRSDGITEKLWEGSSSLSCYCMPCSYHRPRSMSISFTDLHKLMTNKDSYLPNDKMSVSFKFTDYNLFNVCYPECMTGPSDSRPIQATNARTLKRRLQDVDAEQQDCAVDSLQCLSEDFSAMLEKMEFADFTLKVGPDAIPVHKVVLCSRSSVFRAMITSSMRESASNEALLPDLRSDTVRQLVRFLYTGSVPDLDPADALDLFAAADQFDVPSLRRLCARVLTSGLCPGNVCRVLTASALHSDPDLKEASVQYIEGNKDLVFPSQEWAALMQENSSLALEVYHGLQLKSLNS